MTLETGRRPLDHGTPWGVSALLGPGALHERMRAALAGASGIDDVELSFEGGSLGSSRFARSQITQAGAVIDRTLRARVRVGRRVGSARTSDLDDASGAIRRAAEAARALPEPAQDAVFPTPPPADAGPDPRYAKAMARAFHGDTAALGPEVRAALLGQAIEVAAAAGCHLAGSVATSAGEWAVVSTRGLQSYHRSTAAKLEIIATHGADERATGFATTIGHDAATLAPRELSRVACEKASRGRGAIDLGPGEYDVILEPPAVSELLEWLATTGFGSQSMLDGSSFLSGRRGQRLCGPEITIYDDGLDPDPAALVTPADCEGVRKQRVTLIDAGLGGPPVLDSKAALELGGASTGHATPLTDTWNDGSVPTNLAMVAGDDATDALYGRLDRGLVITRFHYVNGLIDTRRAVMTGMTRDGVFQVTGGKLGPAVRNLRWTQGILEAFSRVAGVTRERRAVPVWWSPAGGFLCPTLLLRGFRFTGTTGSAA